MTQYLIFLAILPVAVFGLSGVFMARRRYLYTGLATGFVIAPVSMALLKFSAVPIIGKAIGLVGLVGNLIHGSVGYFFLVSFGGLEPGVLLSTAQLVDISVVNALIWGGYYSMVGFNIDGKLAAAKGQVSKDESLDLVQHKAI